MLLAVHILFSLFARHTSCTCSGMGWHGYLSLTVSFIDLGRIGPAIPSYRLCEVVEMISCTRTSVPSGTWGDHAVGNHRAIAHE
jgi:hypothetical protein